MPETKPRRLSDEELKVVVDTEIDNAMSYMDSELSDDRAKAMERYLGELLGNEIEGRSKVQTRDVMTTIEWIMPTLVEIFTASDRAVEFVPVGPEDEEQADQEADYLNHVFYTENEGFLILYSWFKDALLSKNGVTKCYPEEVEEVTKETYHRLLDIELESLAADDELELFEKESYTEQLETPQGLMEAKLHDVTFTRTVNETKIRVENVPPEEFVISRDATSVNPANARFTAHITTKTVSELREMGYTDGEIGMMDFGDDEVEISEERLARMHLEGEERWNESIVINTGMRQVRVKECYTRADRDGDGYAELLKIFRSGDFIDIEEIDYHPFNALTPIILTHKFHGLSIADILIDIQEIRTGLFRAYMDNIYQTINGKTYFDQNSVNLDDMLSDLPYGIVAVDGPPGQAILRHESSGLPSEAFNLNELLDTFLNERVGDFRSQLDPNVLAQANTGVVLNMLNEAKAKVFMIARIFAEVGVKPLFRNLHHLARKYADRETRIKLRNSWVPVDPREWRERTNLRVKVGLGTQNKQETIANLQQMMDVQSTLLQQGFPVVTPQNLYNAAKEWTESLGYVADKYWTDPRMIPPPPQQEDPNVQMMQLQAQLENQKTEQRREESYLKAQLDQAKLQSEREKTAAMMQNDAAKNELQRLKQELDTMKDLSKDQRESIDLALKERAMNLEHEAKQISQALEAIKAENQETLEKYQADLKAEVELLKAQPQDNETPKMIAQLSDQIDNLNQQLRQDDQEVEYDEQGRIIRIGSKQIERGTDGRVTRVRQT